MAVVLTYSRSGIVDHGPRRARWVVLSGAAFQSLAVLGLADRRRGSRPRLRLSQPRDHGRRPGLLRARRHDGAIFAPVLLAAPRPSGGATYSLLARPGPSAAVRRTAVRVTAAALVRGAVRGPDRVGRRTPGAPSPGSRRAGTTSRAPRTSPRRRQAGSARSARTTAGRGGRRRGARSRTRPARGGARTVRARQRARANEADHGHAAAQPLPAGAERHGDRRLPAAGRRGRRGSSRRDSNRPPARPGPSGRRRSRSRSRPARTSSSRWWTSTGTSSRSAGSCSSSSACSRRARPPRRKSRRRGRWRPGRSPAWPPRRSSSRGSRRGRRRTRTRRSNGARTPRRPVTPGARTRSTRSRSSRCTRSGWRRRLRGDAREAERSYARAVREQPDNPETWFNLGDFELQAGDRKTACAFLERATELDPFDKTAVAERTEACGLPKP